MKTCHDHLESKTPVGEKHIVPANQSALVVAKDKLSNLLQKCLDNEYITQEEYQARLGSDMNPGKCYSIFKVHKEHKDGELPPVRPIVSGCGSMFEITGIFVEHHMKQDATQHAYF